MSAGTIHVILSVLRSILNFAAKGGVYTSEPIRYPHLAGTSQEVQIMKLANYNQLEKFLIDNISDFHFGLLLCMHTGIRVGELSGLRWEDVDFAQHKIRIQRTVIRIKNLDQTANPDTGKIPKTILYIGPPKTAHQPITNGESTCLPETRRHQQSISHSEKHTGASVRIP